MIPAAVSRALDAMRETFRAKLRSQVRKARVLAVKDDGATQLLQVRISARDVRWIKAFYFYGFTSHPKVGSEVVYAKIADDPDHLLVFGTIDEDGRYRGLVSEATAIYAGSAALHLLPDGKVAIGQVAGEELLDLFNQCLVALEQTTVNTMLGAQPLSKFVDGTITAIKVKLATIQGALNAS